MEPIDHYWVRLNEQPRLSLPAAEGSDAIKRFEEVSRALRIQQEQRDKYVWVQDRCNVRNQVVDTLSKRTSVFFYWSSQCFDPSPGPDVAHWGINDLHMLFSYGRAVNYQYRCYTNVLSEYIEVYKEVLLPEQMRGLFYVDWDQDGDLDLAILLATGQYIFFRQDQCTERIV